MWLCLCKYIFSNKFLYLFCYKKPKLCIVMFLKYFLSKRNKKTWILNTGASPTESLNIETSTTNKSKNWDQYTC